MPFNTKLSPDYVWRQAGEAHTLYLDEHALARIAPSGAGWLVETLLDTPGITPQQVAVRRAEYGKGWVGRWILQRQRLVAAACGRPDLAPPVIHGPPRRCYVWQAPSWSRAS
jgi:hypothetical protein